VRVLISAYSCRPGLGSEPGAGWAWTAAATRDHEVWLVTHLANAPAVESMRAADPQLARRLHPVYLHNTWLGQSLRRRGPLRFLYYLAWQLGPCRRGARRLQQAIGFDVCHHVTYASDWAPAGVAGIPGLPFVWGPVGGSATLGTVRLWFALGLRTALSELIRAVLLTALRLIVGRGLARGAAVVIGQNDDVARAFAPIPVLVEPHVAVEPAPVRGRQVGRSEPPVAIMAGRLLGWKGIRLALAALRRPEAAGWRLDIYGDGMLRPQLERLAARWVISARVRFLGMRPRAEVRRAMAEADALLFPSIHDAAGWTVAEALEAGCPVIALRLGGPATLIGPDHGVLIDPSGDIVAALAAGLDTARTLRPSGARWRADRLPDLITGVYLQAVATRRDGPRPEVPA
jgi:glycosyltransferase involved in cell wall biosynthesis